jgi:hypothetical protein
MTQSGIVAQRTKARDTAICCFTHLRKGMFGKLKSAQTQIDLADWFPGPLPNRERLKVSGTNGTFPFHAVHGTGVLGTAESSAWRSMATEARGCGCLRCRRMLGSRGLRFLWLTARCVYWLSQSIALAPFEAVRPSTRLTSPSTYLDTPRDSQVTRDAAAVSMASPLGNKSNTHRQEFLWLSPTPGKPPMHSVPIRCPPT